MQTAPPDWHYMGIAPVQPGGRIDRSTLRFAPEFGGVAVGGQPEALGGRMSRFRGTPTGIEHTSANYDDADIVEFGAPEGTLRWGLGGTPTGIEHTSANYDDADIVEFGKKGPGKDAAWMAKLSRKLGVVTSAADVGKKSASKAILKFIDGRRVFTSPSGKRCAVLVAAADADSAAEAGGKIASKHAGGPVKARAHATMHIARGQTVYLVFAAHGQKKSNAHPGVGACACTRE